MDLEKHPSPPEDESPESSENQVAFGPKNERVFDDEMDMTPMVDVTFLLLVFFMVTVAFAMQKALQIPAPNDDEPSTNVQETEDVEDDHKTVIVRVDADSLYIVSTPDWEEEAPSKQDLLIKLRTAKQGGKNTEPPSTLLVIADGEALHGKVVAALDAGSAVKMENVQLTTVESGE